MCMWLKSRPIVTFKIVPTHHSFRYYHPASQWRPSLQWTSLSCPFLNHVTVLHCGNPPSTAAARSLTNRDRLLPPPRAVFGPTGTVCRIWERLIRLSFRLLGEQWCSIRLTAPRTTWLSLSNRGFMRQGWAAELLLLLLLWPPTHCVIDRGGLIYDFLTYLWGFIGRCVFTVI